MAAARKEYIGRLAVKFTDGREAEFSVYRTGRDIWLNEYRVPSNQSYSWAALDTAIGAMYASAVESRRWIETSGKPLF